MTNEPDIDERLWQTTFLVEIGCLTREGIGKFRSTGKPIPFPLHVAFDQWEAEKRLEIAKQSETKCLRHT